MELETLTQNRNGGPENGMITKEKQINQPNIHKYEVEECCVQE